MLAAAIAVVAAVALFDASTALAQPEPPREGQAGAPHPGQPFPPQGEGEFPPRRQGPGGPGGQGGPGGFPGMGAMAGGGAALTAHGEFVFVVRGNTLYQFLAKDLKLVKKVTLSDEPSFGPMGRPGGEPRGKRPPQQGRE